MPALLGTLFLHASQHKCCEEAVDKGQAEAQEPHSSCCSLTHLPRLITNEFLFTSFANVHKLQQ